MSTGENLDKFKDLFILRTDSRVEEEVDIDNNSPKNEDFGTLASEVSEEIENLEHKGKSIESKKIKEQEQNKDESLTKISGEKQKMDKTDMDDYDSIDHLSEKEEKIEQDNEPVEIGPLPGEEEMEDNNKQEEVEDNNKEEVEKTEEDNEEEYIEAETGIKIINGQVQWLLESPSKIYNRFYETKRELVFNILGNCQIPFDKYRKELEESSVDVSSEVFDGRENYKKMEKIQVLRDRVKTIQVKCNSQYYIVKRWIELLKGVLSRIQYLKPVIKQEGLYYDHMRDLEYYYAQLEDLNDSADKISKNLSAAYKVLEIKMHICIPLKSPDTYDKSYLSRQESSRVNKDFDEYDDLPDNASVKKDSGKAKFVGW